MRFPHRLATPWWHSYLARYAAIQRIIGLLVLMFSLSMLPPLALSLWLGDGEEWHFGLSLVLVLGAGLALWLPARTTQRDLHDRDGFVIVALFWTVLGALGCLPFMFGPHLSLVDALFESVSGFTTTGATVMTGLDRLPLSVHLYRQELQWLGGMGLIVLAVAVLPMLGIGGMQLYRAETPGPMKEQKLFPRLADTAKALWLIYVGLTAVCALAYWVAGMSPFDALAHSLSTLSTGGFSTHDASMAHFASPAVEQVANLFMLAAAINFSMHFVALSERSPGVYLRDPEVRTFLLIVALSILFCTAVLAAQEPERSHAGALRAAAFQVISVITSTGFTTENFAAWPLALPFFLMSISFIGGCGGSTAGGMKVVRILLLVKQGVREVLLLIHPHATLPMKLGRMAVKERVMAATWGFFSVYVALYMLLSLLMLMTGADLVTALSAVATSLNNMGPGLGEASSNFLALSSTGKLIAIGAMLLGRLEVFTFLVLVTALLWRK
jgi:trk system potassium uptake protein TrkH